MAYLSTRMNKQRVLRSRSFPYSPDEGYYRKATAFFEDIIKFNEEAPFQEAALVLEGETLPQFPTPPAAVGKTPTLLLTIVKRTWLPL